MLAADRRVRRGDSRVFMVGLRIYESTNGRMGKSANLQIAMVGQVYHRWGCGGRGIACGRFLC
jgi:hypothetical protein